MSLLGTVGSLYMAILIVLLIIGLGLIGLSFFRYIFDSDRIKVKKIKKEDESIGRLIRVALFSFIGIVVSFFILLMLNGVGNV